MTTIPASLFVEVTPSVLAAAGEALDVIGLGISTSTRVPIGSVYSFSTPAAVAAFFGPTSHEATFAGGGASLGSGYFGGFTNAGKLPGALLFAQYATANVSAYLRGGNISLLPLATLQGYSGTLSVTIDGVLKTASVNLSSVTSFSGAAETIAADLGIEGVESGTVTGSIGGTGGTCTTTGTTLTMGSLASGEFQVGDTLTASDGGGHTLVAQTILAQLSGTAGGSAGATFQMSAAGTGGDLTSTTVTAKGTTMTVTAGTARTIGSGDVLSGSGIAANTYVTGQITPLVGSETTGGIGRYTISAAQSGVVASETITVFTPAVQYDSVSGAFTITSGTAGVSSTITFGSGAMATDLLLTSATGAVLSQGSAAMTPAAFMNSVVNQTTNWVTYATLFDPDGGSGNSVKQAFAAWKNSFPDRYMYVCWDSDVTPRASVPASGSLGIILKNNGDSGTYLQSELTDLNQAAFVMGAFAAIDFTKVNGRTTMAFRSQAGLVADVTTETAAINLGGNPQVVGDFGNGYNYYGAVGQANQSFTWEQRGTVTGPFQWADSYVNQVWWNNLMQSALLDLANNSPSIPFNGAGASQIEMALNDPIEAGLTFGAAAPGTIDSSQAAEVNTAAGANISDTLQTTGYYLQVLQQSSAVRANRGPWAITLWYLDRGSVQSFSLSSIALQ